MSISIPPLNQSNNSLPAYDKGEAVGEEDEWEYEYDRNQTEDFYFTLDMSTHDPITISSKTTEANTATIDQPAASSVDDNARDEVAEPVAAKTLEILDLHTKNPLIRYDQKFFNGYWMTDLGTKFHVAETRVVEKPLKPGNVVDIVGMSRVRLVGRPVTIQERSNVRPGMSHYRGASSQQRLENRQPSSVHTNLDTVNAATNNPAIPLVVPTELMHTASLQAHGSFLERLSRIKIQRGESDNVPIVSMRLQTPHTTKGGQSRQQLPQASTEEEEPRAPKRKQSEALELDVGNEAENQATTKRSMVTPPDTNHNEAT